MKLWLWHSRCILFDCQHRVATSAMDLCKWYVINNQRMKGSRVTTVHTTRRRMHYHNLEGGSITALIANNRVNCAAALLQLALLLLLQRRGSLLSLPDISQPRIVAVNLAERALGKLQNCRAFDRLDKRAVIAILMNVNAIRVHLDNKVSKIVK